MKFFSLVPRGLFCSISLKHYCTSITAIICNFFFYFFYVDIRVSLHAPRLITRPTKHPANPVSM
jgi:hypothetical protein